MGSNKRAHIAAILAAPHVADAWAAAHAGVPAGEADIDTLYAAFTPIQVDVVRGRAGVIPGEWVGWQRRARLRLRMGRRAGGGTPSASGLDGLECGGGER